jgi:hypothetical protein
MYKFYYHICAIPNGNKYLVRKYIFDEDFNFINQDDYNFTYKNVNTLINKLDKGQYKKFDTSILDKIEKPTQDEIIKSVIDDVMGDSGNGQITFEKFLSGNLSYP